MEGTGRDAVKEALVLLRLLPGLGDRTFARLLHEHGGPLGVLALPDRPFAAAAGEAAAGARREAATRERARAILRRCDALGIRVMGLDDPGYPRSLLRLPDPPPVLFHRGVARFPAGRVVAIVGSRRATPVGRRAAERFGRDLSLAGVSVVSGMAFGIDAAAHRGALDGPGGTVAVLGSGPDRAYPPSLAPLFERILASGLVVSEFPPGEEARPYHFPRRNRVIAALSHAVVVVEAARKSGALITAGHALDLGLEVFAVPGSVEAPQAGGTNALLRDGAGLMVDATDLLVAMGWGPGGVRSGSNVPGARAAPGEGGPREEPVGRPPSPEGPVGDRALLLPLLDRVPVSLDRLLDVSGLPAGRALAALARLEAEGACRREFAGWTAAAR